jgi:hypothetical protein
MGALYSILCTAHNTSDAGPNWPSLITAEENKVETTVDESRFHAGAV